MQSILQHQPGIKAFLSKQIKKVKFQSKVSKNNTMCLGGFCRVNKVGKIAEMIGTLKLPILMETY